MRNISRVLIATAFSTLAVSAMTPTTWAADDGDSIKTSRPPYKPGRQIEYDMAQQVQHATAVKLGLAGLHADDEPGVFERAKLGERFVQRGVLIAVSAILISIAAGHFGLAGARVGRIAFPRLRAQSAGQPPCARQHCARSLSAIR